MIVTVVVLVFARTDAMSQCHSQVKCSTSVSTCNCNMSTFDSICWEHDDSSNDVGQVSSHTRAGEANSIEQLDDRRSFADVMGLLWEDANDSNQLSSPSRAGEANSSALPDDSSNQLSGHPDAGDTIDSTLVDTLSDDIGNQLSATVELGMNSGDDGNTVNTGTGAHHQQRSSPDLIFADWVEPNGGEEEGRYGVSKDAQQACFELLCDGREGGKGAGDDQRKEGGGVGGREAEEEAEQNWKRRRQESSHLVIKSILARIGKAEDTQEEEEPLAFDCSRIKPVDWEQDTTWQQKWIKTIEEDELCICAHSKADCRVFFRESCVWGQGCHGRWRDVFDCVMAKLNELKQGGFQVRPPKVYYIGITLNVLVRWIGNSEYKVEYAGHGTKYVEMHVLVHGCADMIWPLEVAAIEFSKKDDNLNGDMIRCDNVGQGGEHWARHRPHTLGYLYCCLG